MGALSARSFLDGNGNGRLDPGETPLPGVGFLLNGGGNLARTDDAGEAFLPNLQPYQDLAVGVATSTLEDPFLKPATDGVRIVPRPGKTAVVDFPVRVAGEITGRLFLRRDGLSRAAGGVELELVDEKGLVVRKVRSAYDGFYDVTEVGPGSYTLRVSGDQLAVLRLAAAPSRQVAVGSDGTVLEGFDFFLTGAPGAPGEEAMTVAAREPAPPPPMARVAAARPAQPAPPPAPPPAATSLPTAPARPRAPAPEARRIPVFAAREWTGGSPIYAVQLAAYRERAKAESDARSLEGRLRCKTHVFAVDLGAKGTWYRVLAGELPTAEAALAFQRQLAAMRFREVGLAYRVEVVR